MRALPPVARYKKQLSIAALFVFILVIIQFRETIQSQVNTSRIQIPIPHDGTNIPQSSASGDPIFDVTESLKIRKQLGKDIQKLFDKYRPPISTINPTWWKNWPPVLALQVDKKYNYSEIVEASGDFFIDEKAKAGFETQQHALLKAIPTWETVKKAYSGRGVVISAGSPHLHRVWPNVVLMMRNLNSTLPIEVWTKDRTEFDITMPLVKQLRDELNISISIHTIADFMSITWDALVIPEVFKVKPLSLLFSSFDEVVLLDADSVPVVDPNVLFDSEKADSGLIQWPDFWANSVSTVFHDVYNMSHTEERTCESGQMLLIKRKQFEPLVLATYHNWWGHNFFYKLIYLDSMGAGDKDTLWVAAAAYHRDYHIVRRPLELIPLRKLNGSFWKEPQSLFNGAMGQFNPLNNSEIFTMHLHSPKINMQAPELAGQFDVSFFRTDPSQNVNFEHGEKWLETKIWEQIKWIECDSVLKVPKTNACEGARSRLASM